MFTLILGAVIGIGTLVFAFQNTEIVMVDFLTYQFEGSVALIIILSLIAGFVIGVFFLMPHMFNESRRTRKMEKEMIKIEDNSNSLGIQYDEGGLINEFKQQSD